MAPDQWNDAKRLNIQASTMGVTEAIQYVWPGCANSIIPAEVETLFSCHPRLNRPSEAQHDPALYSSGHFIGRFEVLRLLGSGGAGAVYEVRDPSTETLIAVKVLYKDNPEFLVRFKNEFRSLVNIRHDNLVKLYSLFANDHSCFFTMELIQGGTLVEYARSLVHSPAFSPVHFDHRLRPALFQLASGVAALHEAGKLHRDISPSNVLISPQGRVVILDFGLVLDLDARKIRNTIVAGKPAYMAPETVIGTALTKAADWYSVGAVLYECLTGTAPFPNSFRSLLSRGEDPVPPSPRDLEPGVPSDLDALCMQLLSFDPVSRPSAADVLECLSQCPYVSPLKTLSRPRPPLIGRSPHIAILHDAFSFTRQFGAAMVLAVGRSGTGKTALLEEFERELSVSCPEALILSGTCHQSEAIPFKALDRCIDELYKYLSELPSSVRETLIPASFSYVARLFPVFASLVRQCSHLREPPTISDSQELRKCAFSSLLELLTRIAEHTPVVISIDDLQWGDLDSSALFANFLLSPSPPSILAIASYRSEDAEGSEFLRALRPLLETQPLAVKRFEVRVDDFNEEEAGALLHSLLGSAMYVPDLQSRVIVRECGGNPFLVEQWARYLLQSSTYEQSPCSTGLTECTWPQLTDIVGARLSGLSEGELHALEIVAVAGHPISDAVVCSAASLDELTPRTLADLIHHRFLRAREKDGKRELEPYHDKLRTVVIDRLTRPQLCALHKKIAAAMEIEEGTDEALLATHLREAGEGSAAREYAKTAAEKAARALAFNRAASLYQIAIGCNENASDTFRLLERCGDALVMAGRGSEAAECYCRAADLGGSEGERLTLQQRAAEQLLRSGHAARGLGLLNKIGAAMRFRIATSRAGLVMLPLRYLRRRTFGLRFEERSSQNIDAALLARLDAYWSFVIGFSMVDMSRAALVASKHLALALKAGEPCRIALSLVFETGLNFFASQSYRLKMCQQVREIGLRLDDPRVIGCAAMLEGSSAILSGQFRRAVTISEEAEQVFRHQCTGVAWELTSARTFLLAGLAWQGLWREFSAKVDPMLRDATERGDLYAITQLTLGSGLTWRGLVLNQPAQTEASVRDVISKWPASDFDLLHFWAYYSLTDIALYEGDGERAWSHVSEYWSLLSQMMLLKSNFFTVSRLYLRAKAALAAARELPRSSRKRRALVRVAGSCAARIARSRASWAIGQSALIRAGVASASDDQAHAIQEMAAAEAAFVTAEMNMHASVARFRRGQLSGGTAGSALIESAENAMREQGVVLPALIANMLAPGEWAKAR